MCKDSVFVSTLARKAKCFLCLEQIIVDSNKIFDWENCLLIILSCQFIVVFRKQSFVDILY